MRLNSVIVNCYDANHEAWSVGLVPRTLQNAKIDIFCSDNTTGETRLHHTITSLCGHVESLGCNEVVVIMPR